MTKNILLQSLDPEKLEDKAFELIRTAIGKGIRKSQFARSRSPEKEHSTKDQKIQIRSDEVAIHL